MGLGPWAGMYLSMYSISKVIHMILCIRVVDILFAITMVAQMNCKRVGLVNYSKGMVKSP